MMSPTSKIAKQVSRNYNIDIIQRILDALYEMGKSRITDIVVCAGLNHHTTKRYLNLMSIFDWIYLEREESHVTICLTETGIFVHNKLHESQQTMGFLTD